LNRPIAGVAKIPGANGGPEGKLCVVGSTRIFDDDFYDNEKNAKLQDVLFKWLTGLNDCVINPKYGEEAEVAEHHYIPNTQLLSESLKSCLQENFEKLPRDFTQMFDSKLFRFDTDLIPEAIRLSHDLNLKHEPLTLIPPHFETPLPALRLAVFPPVLGELPAPQLDLFDLDEQFASEKARLAQLTNKCNDDDLEYYIKESGDILNIPVMG